MAERTLAALPYPNLNISKPSKIFLWRNPKTLQTRPSGNRNSGGRRIRHFIPRLRLAMESPAERYAYVAALAPDHKSPSGVSY
jgi:hypothetical protein